MQTELGGPQMAVDPRAMPLDDFVQEVMQILTDGTVEQGEILVKNVQPLRWAEKNGQYKAIFTALASF